MENPPQTPPQTPPKQPQQHPDEDKNPELFTCEICVEPTPFANNKFRNGPDGCSHLFCTACVVNYIRAKLENDNVGRIKCPDLNCDQMLNPRACESLVGPSVFVRWCDVLCEEAVGGLDRCYCPNAKCSELIVNECSELARKSMCPECRRWFCFECKIAWHVGSECDEENGEMRDGNEIAFRRSAEDGKWMRCPQCRHFVVLNGGCWSVLCRCGIRFCYKCGKQVDRHWCDCGVAGPLRCRDVFYRIIICVFLLWVVFRSDES